MAKVTCKIDLKLPSLNDYINKCRGNKHGGANFKKKYENEIGLFISNLPQFENPVRIKFIWVEGDRRRDLDNIASAKKFILDALVKCGKLKNDNSKYVVGFEDVFKYSKKHCVILEIEEVEG